MTPVNLPYGISALPPGVTIGRITGAPLGSSMGSWQPFAAPPCPFSPDDATALRSLAAPLRQVLGAPHKPVADPQTLATALIRLEHITKKIEALITLSVP